jgi:hypothetical protein
MNARQPTLIEILRPQRFTPNPARTKVTRTVLQPDVDEFERFAANDEAPDGGKGSSRSVSPRRGAEQTMRSAP